MKKNKLFVIFSAFFICTFISVVAVYLILFLTDCAGYFLISGRFFIDKNWIFKGFKLAIELGVVMTILVVLNHYKKL